ncbi:MAG: hypothetical protein ACXWWJ_09540, partial [Nitrospira sp.]
PNRTFGDRTYGMAPAAALLKQRLPFSRVRVCLASQGYDENLQGQCTFKCLHSSALYPSSRDD